MRLHLPQLLNRLPLQTVLTIPFVIQVVGVAGVIGYLSFRNSQLTAQTLAAQLLTELTGRISQQVETTVESPYIVNQINANSFLRGDLDLLAENGEHQFWQQAQIFSSVNLAYCATEADGAFLGVGQSLGGVGDGLQTYLANPQTNRQMHFYGIDETGQRSALRGISNQTYDPRQRPWYETVKQMGDSAWSPVYLDFETLLPTITAATPIHDDQSGELLGVCATDIILSQELSNFLKSLEISQSGIAFILEPSGSLIASSTPEPITQGAGEMTELLPANESKNPLIQATTQYLEQQYDALAAVDSTQHNVRLQSSRHYVETVRFNDDYGLDWIIVLVVPEADFMAPIYRSTQTALILCAIALVITILIGLYITRWLSRPLQQLSAVAQGISRGEWDTPIELNRHDVIGDLSRSFATMTQQLQVAFKDLESRIDERTVDLLNVNQELQLISHVDGLTQIANRRYFDRYFEQEWQRLEREQHPLALLLCDVDYFKQFNDYYGHQAGDRCLQQIAHLLAKTVHRPADLVARYGGEEFVVLLSNTDTAGARAVAGNILKTLRELQIPHEVADSQRLSLSLGIATVVPQPSVTPAALLAAADLALYEAKSQGRDRYAVAANLQARSHPI